MAQPENSPSSEKSAIARDLGPRSDESQSNEKNAIIRALYHRYFSKLVDGLRRTYGAGPPDPEDVAQTAFEKLSRKPEVDQIKDLEGYVWIAARNIVLTEKRREATKTRNSSEIERRFFGETSDVFEPERVFIGKEDVSHLIKVLETMSARRRKIFLLNRVHGLSTAEAARRCGVSRTAAVRHIAEATKQLQAAMIEAQEQKVPRK